MFTSSLTELARQWSLPSPVHDQTFHGISIDSRQDNTGRLFIAIRGEHVDGHAYLTTAQQQGAVAALVEQYHPDITLPQLVVKDTRLALGDIGRLARARLKAKVLALTGSCGKTTTKNLLASICSQAAPSAATRGNLNNDYGVPLTLAGLPEDIHYAVIEMGANHQQEIAYLTDIARPDIALITNVGPVHLEGFGGLDGVAHGKGEIFRGLSTDGIAVINLDDAFAPYWQALTKDKRQVTFGTHAKAMIRAEAMSLDGVGHPTFTLITPQGQVQVSLQLLGMYNIFNALAAAAAAFAADIPLAAIAAGLAAQAAGDGRMQLRPGYQGAQIFNDTYNANPLAMKMALQLLATQPGRKIFVMGDMGELGPESASWHARVGEMAASLHIDALYAVGTLSTHAVQAFGTKAHHFTDKKTLIASVREILDANTYVLVKGSRSAGMEEVVQAICYE